MKPACSGAEPEVTAWGILFQPIAAVPDAGAAMDAFLAVELGHTAGPAVSAWPEHISMHILAAQRSQKSG